MRIDAHVHVTPDGGWFGSRVNASVKRLFDEMDRSQIERSVVIALPGVADNLFVSDLCRTYTDRLWGFGTLDFDSGPELAKQVEQIGGELGLKGLKVHPRLQGLDPLDERLQEPLEKAAELGMPVMFCTNLGPGSIGLEHLQPFVYDTLAKRHKQTIFILAHACVQKPLDAFYIAKSNANVFLDMSMVLNYLPGTSAYNDLLFVCEKLDRKVIFGSDFPESSIPSYLELFEGEMKTRNADIDINAVCGGNLLKILGEGGTLAKGVAVKAAASSNPATRRRS